MLIITFVDAEWSLCTLSGTLCTPPASALSMTICHQPSTHQTSGWLWSWCWWQDGRSPLSSTFNYFHQCHPISSTFVRMTLTLVLVPGWQFPTFPQRIPFLRASVKVGKKVLIQKLIFAHQKMIHTLKLCWKDSRIDNIFTLKVWCHMPFSFAFFSTLNPLPPQHPCCPFPSSSSSSPLSGLRKAAHFGVPVHFLDQPSENDS